MTVSSSALYNGLYPYTFYVMFQNFVTNANHQIFGYLGKPEQANVPWIGKLNTGYWALAAWAGGTISGSVKADKGLHVLSGTMTSAKVGELRLDGKLIGSGAFDYPCNGTVFQFGCGTYNKDMDIYKAGVFLGEMTETQLKDIYNSGSKYLGI
jgi:hypothetical protein